MTEPDSQPPIPNQTQAGRDGPVPEVSELDEDHSSSSRLGPFVVGAVMLALGLLLLKETFDITGEGFDPQGPRFLPLVIVVAWLALSAIYLVQHAFGVLRGHGGEPAERFDHMVNVGVLVVLLIVYAIVLDTVGYWIATSVFFVGAARTMGSRNLVRDVVMGVGMSLVIYLAFSRGLGVHLPEGVLGF